MGVTFRSKLPLSERMKKQSKENLKWQERKTLMVEIGSISSIIGMLKIGVRQEF
jgi:hypothetical protein